MVVYENKSKAVFFLWDSGEDARFLDTQDITKLFSVPLGFHPVMTSIQGRQNTGTSLFDLFGFVDPTQRNREGKDDAINLNQFQFNLDQSPPVIHGSMLSKKFFWTTHIGGNGNLHKSAGYHYHIWDSMQLIKGDGEWQVTIQYFLAPGAMMWLDEWAQLIRQKRNIPKQTTAGRKFHQVGNYHVLRRYNLL